MFPQPHLRVPKNFLLFFILSTKRSQHSRYELVYLRAAVAERAALAVSLLYPLVAVLGGVHPEGHAYLEVLHRLRPADERLDVRLLHLHLLALEKLSEDLLAYLPEGDEVLALLDHPEVVGGRGDQHQVVDALQPEPVKRLDYALPHLDGAPDSDYCQ